MKTFTHVTAILCFLAVGVPPAAGQLIPNLGGQRAGISAYQFLKIGAGARGVAMGESFVAVANDASALYWNPAGLVQFNENEVTFSHSWYVVDIKHEFLGAVYHLSATDAVGISVIALHMPDMEVTTEAQPFGTGRMFAFGDLGIGLTYSRRMTDQFSFGITARYVDETLDMLHMRGVLADIGTYYWTGLGSSRFAVVVSNFGADVSPSGDVTDFDGNTISSFQSFSPPTIFKLGFAMDPLVDEHQRVTTSLELHHPNDNAENLHLGVEYEWEKYLALRLGVQRTIGERLLKADNSAAGDFTAGIGLRAPLATYDARFDFAYANFNALGGVYRITVELTF